MKKTNVKKSLAALSAVAILGAGALSVSAVANASAWNRASGNAANSNTKKVESTTVGQGKHLGQLTDAQKTELEKQRTIRQQADTERRTAVTAALNNGDYAAWQSAVGTSSPLLTKINANNFPKLVEAYKLEKQADQIFKDLGLERGEGMGMGMGLGRMGMGHGPASGQVQK